MTITINLPNIEIIIQRICQEEFHLTAEEEKCLRQILDQKKNNGEDEDEAEKKKRIKKQLDQFPAERRGLMASALDLIIGLQIMSLNALLKQMQETLANKEGR